jgi:hypothetical protein
MSSEIEESPDWLRSFQVIFSQYIKIGFFFLSGFCVFGLWVFLFSLVLLQRESFRFWVLVFTRCNWKNEFSFHVLLFYE